MRTLEDLQRLTPSQGALLYRLVELEYLTQSQVDELINRLAQDRFAKAREYLVFAQNLALNEPLHQPQIISRCLRYVPCRSCIGSSHSPGRCG